MNETWLRSGAGLAHLIKFSGDRYFTTACNVIIPKKSATRTPIQRVVEAQGMNEYINLPADGYICAECERKVRER